MLSKYIYRCRYDFDNFEYPYRFKIKFRNGSKFIFLNNYYEYFFYPSEKEQCLFSYCILKKQDEEVAENNIKFSNNVLQYIFCIPISRRDLYIEKRGNNLDIKKIYNISDEKQKKLDYISNKILKFKKEKDFFKEIMKLNSIALSNLVNFNIEDSILYYFKIIEKISKKNYIKFHERNYTKIVKKNNKVKLKNFIKDYFKENLKVSMTENMLNTAVDKIYIKLRNEAYNSIFMKISFFFNSKEIDFDSKNLSDLVKTRNKLAHGDFVDKTILSAVLGTAIYLSNECVAMYFFQKRYKEIHFDTNIYEDDMMISRE